MKAEQYETYDRVFLILDAEDNYEGEITDLPECTVAVVRYRGSHKEAAEQYRKLIDFITENHLQIAGSSFEITRIDYGYTNDTDKFVTEIQIPVTEK